MFDARLLLLSLLIVTGWAVSRASLSLARTIARASIIAAVIVLAVLFASGVAYESRASAEIHRWSAHGLVILVWTSVPFCLGALWHQKLARRPIATVFQTVQLLFTMVAALVGSFTGYLGPLRNPDVDAETHNRFTTLHIVALPIVLLANLMIWYVAFREVPAKEAKTSPADSQPRSGGIV